MSGVRRLEPPKAKGKWIERWAVDSDGLSDEYTVARDREGLFGCTCPAWKFSKAPKKDCKHIDSLRSYLRKPAEPSTGKQLGDVKTLLAWLRDAADCGDIGRVGELRRQLEAHRGLTAFCTETIDEQIKAVDALLLAQITG
jgi:hypothetical protein